MNTPGKTKITITASIKVPVEKAWDLFTDTEHVKRWNNASADWHTPRAENDLRTGGRFIYRMEARDGSAGFDFSGTYTKVVYPSEISYLLDDEREVSILFKPGSAETEVTETFEAENINSIELQRAGWQSILDNFGAYAVRPTKLVKLHFETEIGAAPGKVYKLMLDDKNWRDWTSIFNPSSYFKGSWEKGSKILFLGTDSDNKTGGMVSRIKENIPNEFVSIEHYGIISDGQEITEGAEAATWSGSLENYTFMKKEGKTLLLIDMDSSVDFVPYFNETWPKALDRLREICEKQTEKLN